MLFRKSHSGESCGTERLALFSAFKSLYMLLCLKLAKGTRKVELYEVDWVLEIRGMRWKAAFRALMSLSNRTELDACDCLLT